MTSVRVRAAKIAAIAGLFLVVPAFATSSYLLRISTLMVVFALFTIALNVVFGHTDQLFLVVGGLGGIGGYTMVLTANELGVTPWVTIPVGVVLAGLVAGGLSYIAAKRRFTVIVIAIFTLAFQLALTEFFIGANTITGGSDGIPVERIGLDDRLVFYYLLVVVLVVYLVGYDRLVNSRYGFAFSSIREDELAAESVGIDAVRYKTAAGLLAGMMIGLTGALYALTEGYISPAVYSFENVDVLILIMLTLGGMRTLVGPVLGAAVVFWLDEFLIEFQQWRLFVFGVLLILLFLYFRDGVVPKVTERLEARDMDLASVLDE